MSFFKNFFRWYFSKRALPYWCVLAMDCLIVLFSGYLSYYILNGGSMFASNFWHLSFDLVMSTIVFLVFFKIFHTYSGIVRYSSFVDLGRVVSACACASAVIVALLAFVRGTGLFDEYFVFNSFFGYFLVFCFSCLLMSLARMLVKVLYDEIRVSGESKRVFIYGVQAGGVAIAKAIRNSDPLVYSLKGFVEPAGLDLDMKYLMGVEVHKDDDDLIDTLVSMRIDAMIVSPIQVERFRQRDALIKGLVKRNIQILMQPQEEEWDGKSDPSTKSEIRKVEIEDLLPREKIEVDMNKIGMLLAGKKVLITGAAGSIGSEMVRQVAQFHPEEMILVDQAETPMHDVRLMMARKYPHVPAETIVTSITNQPRMEAIFSEHRPDYVFHAAAYKHVPMMEDNPSEAIQNNVRGTRIIADLAVKYGTKKFVMISTDKAVNPTNVMGCSKRICEIYCQSLNKAIVEGKIRAEGLEGAPIAKTQFVTTRFGNVLGSNGSVIPLFREQIAKGGPVTVTHPDIIRFFMLISEACKLVLEAGTLGHGGEIFVFDMGQPVKIVDLASRMIELSGAKNIEIKFTGLRDGEKLYEEVLSDKENTVPTPNPKIMVASVREYDYAVACENEDRLLEASYRFDDMEVVRIMKEIVPEFRSQHSKYEVLDK